MTAILTALGLSQRLAKLAKLLGILIPLGLVLALSAFLWARGNHFRAERDHWYEATLKWQAANKAATKWAEAEKAAKDAAAREAKGAADAKLKPSLDAGDDIARRYADANRCVRVEAAKGRGERADLPGTAGAAAKPEGAGGSSEPLVGLSETDVRICVANTLKLENAVGWAADAKAKGLAE